MAQLTLLRSAGLSCLACLVSTLLGACSSTGTSSSQQVVHPGLLGFPASSLDEPATQPPYEPVAIHWKQQLDQPYVYLDHIGDYQLIGQSISRMLAVVESTGLRTSGPLFCLYYDNPRKTAVQDLRSRVCMPVERELASGSGLGHDVLPCTPVVYAVVEGPRWELPRVYPALHGYALGRGWSYGGPLRETYLNLGDEPSPQELLTEVQVFLRTGP